MPIDIGQFDQRVQLQARVAGQDAHGQANGAWQTVATVWGKVEPLRGREFFAAGQSQSEVEVRVRIRYRSGITTQMRVLWRDAAHDIISVIEPLGAREQLELMCSTGKRDGR